MMKYLRNINFLIGILLLGFPANATFDILELGDGRGNPGPVKLQVKYENKKTKEEEIIFLETLKEEHFDDLFRIRTTEAVYELYADHNKPKREDVEDWLKNKLLPRIGSAESVFPFVLTNKDGAIKGLINIGYGYERDHRMFGVYTEPGKQTGEKEYEEWQLGRGTAAVHAAGDFMMLWHKDHPAQQLINYQGTPVKLWGDTFSTLSATSDADNLGGRIILESFGMPIVSAHRIKELQKKNKNYKEIKNKMYYELSDFADYLKAKDTRH